MKNFRTILLFTAVAALAACSKLTQDNLSKIHNGMTTDEVKALLGTPTDVHTSNVMGVISNTTYTYHSDSFDVKITFLNDKVIDKEGDFK